MSKFSKKIKTFGQEYVANYISIPFLAICFLPLILLDSFILAVCANSSAYLSKVRHFEPFLIGKAISMYYIGSFLGSMMGGLLTLRFSSIKLASFSGIVLGLLLLLLIHAEEAAHIKDIMLFVGLLVNIFSTSNLSSFLKTANKDPVTRLRLVNLELALFNLNFSLSAFILIKFNGAQINYVLLLASICLCVLGAGLYFFRNIKEFYPPKIKNKEELCKPKNATQLLVVIVTVFVVGLIFSMIKVIYLPTIENRFGDNGISVIITSINPWIIFFVQPYLIGKIAKKNNKLLMGIGGLVIGFGYFLFGLTSSLIISILGLIFLTFGEMIYCPISKNIIISIFDYGREGFALGLWRATFLGSGFIGPVMSGWIAETQGNLLVWQICFILGLVCFLISLGVSRNVSVTKYNC